MKKLVIHFGYRTPEIDRGRKENDKARKLLVMKADIDDAEDSQISEGAPRGL